MTVSDLAPHSPPCPDMAAHVRALFYELDDDPVALAQFCDRVESTFDEEQEQPECVTRAMWGDR